MLKGKPTKSTIRRLIHSMQDIFETCIFTIFKSIKKVNCLNKHENDTAIPVEINIHLTGTLEKKDK